MPPPSASGAGGIMRQQAYSDHLGVSRVRLHRSTLFFFSVSRILQLIPPLLLPFSSPLSFIHSFAGAFSQLTHCAGRIAQTGELRCSYPLCCCCCWAPPMLPGFLRKKKENPQAANVTLTRTTTTREESFFFFFNSAFFSQLDDHQESFPAPKADSCLMAW